MGNITINSNITGGGGGSADAVVGASNLTTVGAIPYVSAAGTLNQDATQLFWDAANNRLGIGTNSPSVPLHISGSGFQSIRITSFDSLSFLQFSAGSGSFGFINNESGDLKFQNSSSSGNISLLTVSSGSPVERMRLTHTTGNLLIGTTTDDTTNKLQVAGGVNFGGTSGLTWDNTNKRLGVGTNTPTSTLHVKSAYDSAMVFGYTGIAANTRLSLANTAAVTTVRFDTDSFSYLGTASGANLGIGTTTDSNFKLDVAASGSAGTARFYGGAGVSDITKVVVRAGAGQSTTNLTEWQDSSGTIVAQFKSSDARLAMGVLSGGSYGSSFRAVDFEAWYGSENPFTGSINQRSMLIGTSATGLRVASGYGMYWSANAAGSGDAYGSLDTGLSRNAAGVIEVNNGTAGTYRDLILRRSQHNGVTVANLPAAAAGNAGSIQYVTDANATTIGSTVAGGGANKVMVWSDGAAWKIFAS